MSEPLQPHKEGGLKQPPQTSPRPAEPADSGEIDREGAVPDDREGGMIGEGESEH